MTDNIFDESNHKERKEAESFPDSNLSFVAKRNAAIKEAGIKEEIKNLHSQVISELSNQSQPLSGEIYIHKLPLPTQITEVFDRKTQPNLSNPDDATLSNQSVRGSLRRLKSITIIGKVDNSSVCHQISVNRAEIIRLSRSSKLQQL